MGDTTKETFKKEYDEFSSDEKLEVIKDTQERYLLYIFLQKSGKQHSKLKVDFLRTSLYVITGIPRTYKEPS